eukprot:1161862-Pelagomonas_calceolata.AAC.4
MVNSKCTRARGPLSPLAQHTIIWSGRHDFAECKHLKSFTAHVASFPTQAPGFETLVATAREMTLEYLRSQVGQLAWTTVLSLALRTDVLVIEQELMS